MTEQKQKTTLTASKAVIYAEYRLLHAVIVNPDLLSSPDVSIDLLVHQTPKSVFTAITNLVSLGVPISEHSLFQNTAELDLGVTMDVIESIYNLKEDKLENVSDITGTLKRAVKRLEVSEEIENASDALLNADPGTDMATIKERLQKAQEMLDTLGSSDSDVMDMSQWFEAYFPEFERRKNGKMYPFNDSILDKIIVKGAQPGDIGLIASSTGQGKSTYCLNVINKFINTDVPNMYFTLEMGQVDTMDRLAAIRTGIPFRAIAAPEDDEFASVRDAIMAERKILEQHKLFRICETPTLSINDLVKRIRKFQGEIGQEYCIVVIDLLSQVLDFCKLGTGSHNMAQLMEIAINRLHAVAKELRIHIIGVVQFGRGADSTKVLDMADIDKLRPNRNDIKNANALTERARYVLSLFRPKFYADMYLPELEETKMMQDIVELGSLKMSNGSVGRNFLLFQPETFTMTPMQMDSDLGQAAG